MSSVRQKKLLLIGPLPPPYHGSTVYFASILGSRLRAEFNIRHVDTSDHRSLDNLSRLDIPNIVFALKSIFRLIILSLAWRPDIVYIPISATLLPFLRDGIFILIPSLLTTSRIVIHLHGGTHFRDRFYEESSWFVKAFIRLTLRRVDVAVVLGNSIKRTFEGLVSNIEVVPNGVPDIAPTVHRHETNGAFVAGFLGNLFKRKGIQDVIEAAALIIREDAANLKVKVAGSWPGEEAPLKNELYRFISEKNLTGQIQFLGVVTGREKEGFLHDIDVLVLPTTYDLEGMPLVILEAMAAGKPVITSANTGAISDVVVDGVTGILVDPHEQHQLAAAMRRLMNDRTTRIVMGSEARKRYETFYQLEKNIEGLRQVFMNHARDQC